MSKDKSNSNKQRQSLAFIIVTTGFASCISMLGGIGIEFTEKDLLPIVPLVIALPALNTMVGNYAAIIAAHAGNPAQQSKSRRQLMWAVAKSTLINMSGTVALSIFLAVHRGYAVIPLFAVKYALFVSAAVSSVVFVMFSITYALDKVLEKRKLNPDDVLIPVVTTVTDVFMLGLIALAAKFMF